jgi:hypothetical protein
MTESKFDRHIGARPKAEVVADILLAIKGWNA